MNFKVEISFLLILRCSDKMMETLLTLESLREFKKDSLIRDNHFKTKVINILKAQK